MVINKKTIQAAKKNPGKNSAGFEENRKKMEDYSRALQEAENLKREVAGFISLIHSIQEDLSRTILKMEKFRDSLKKQRNLEERLNLAQRSITMLSNQLQSLSPKIYMVEEPNYPILKKQR